MGTNLAGTEGMERTSRAAATRMEPPAGPVRARSRRGPLAMVRRQGPVTATISVIVGLGLWEILGRKVITNDLFFVPLSSAVERLWQMGRDGELWSNLYPSLLEILLGYGGATIAGIAIGVLMGVWRPLRLALSPWVELLNAIPIIALAPLFILSLGLGLNSKIALIGFFVIWSIVLNTYVGFENADQQLKDMVRSFGSTRWQILRYVEFPHVIPFIAVGMRVALGRAMVGVVVGELFGSTSGIGYFLFQSKDRFDTAGIFTSLILLSAIALIGSGLIRLLERVLAPWPHESSGRNGEF
ncbi:ABC transporter permease [Micromonospora sp. NPDC005087]|uniref:ABC transporter permease n=1 Tax=Micromonospora sp. NPDC005087 TaxID=3364225 RepID=UPI0036B5ACAB